MKNINAYNPSKFKKEWESSDIYKKVCRDFDVVLWDFPGGGWVENPDWITPRWTEINRYTRTTPFYYIEKVAAIGANVINDLGCGCNVFKRYYPNIIGMDNCRFADVQGWVDDKFIAENQNKCEAIIAINSLHFRPLTEFKKSVLDIISILKPGGRAYLAYNAGKLCEESTKNGEMEKLFNTTNPSNLQLDEYIRAQLDEIQTNWLVVDVSVARVRADMHEGNIRLVFEKTL